MSSAADSRSWDGNSEILTLLATGGWSAGDLIFNCDDMVGNSMIEVSYSYTL